MLERCEEALREGSKSFAQAARFFEPKTRAAACLLYAWCRHCDDEIDGESLGHDRQATSLAQRQHRLERLQDQTRRALAGESMADAVFSGLARVVKEHAIPERYPLELLEGFAMDVESRRYATLEDLLPYCYHVAGTVGLMMSHIMHADDEWSLQRAADLGIALQMTNIARDVMEDARSGRIYLPELWLDEAGVPAEQITQPQHRGRVATVAARLLAEADRYYASGDQGLTRLSFRSAWAVAVARGVYSEIGRRGRALGAQAWDRRVIVGRGGKLAWVARGLVDAAAARAFPQRGSAPRAALWTKRLLD